ncbi:MFS general substrate transporter [Armillaria luteobubalina]|uniref:MFS general substrate transporter n=1 Tax=Armillaria luteobubalina TaxID=153913 RepID=A0AA39QJY3_9AGAR|nr:MFS general substrate transporter [Armillaria luteobubalina]
MSTRTGSIELVTTQGPEVPPTTPDNAGTRNESSLAPVDTGFDAWSFLVAAFFIEGIVWGFPDAFGVFLDGYLHDPLFMYQPHASTLLPLIGPLSSGIIYCSGPVIYPITARYPYHWRTMMWVGAVLCSASLFAASYTTKVSTLVGLQGVLYAIGGSLLYPPCISYMSEWFVARRGFANGIIFAGTAIGGLILPLVLPNLISCFGTPKTLRILSITVAVLLVPSLPFVKPRIPESRNRRQTVPPRSRDWIKSPIFWALVATNTVQGFGYFVPIVWLPTFAHEMNLNPTSSSLTVALLNCLSMGYLSDKFNPWFLGMSTLFSTSFATFILWGVLSQNLAGLLAFGAAYGILAGSWTCLWTGFVSPFAKDDNNVATYLFGYLMLSRGLGNILCTPISSAFLATTSDFDFGIARSCFAGSAGIAMLGWVLDAKTRRQLSGLGAR